jgi:hypothetical protein
VIYSDYLGTSVYFHHIGAINVNKSLLQSGNNVGNAVYTQ